MKAWMSLNFGQILPHTPDLSALEHLKNLQCEHSCTFIFDQIFFIFAGNKDNHEVLDEFKIRPDPTMDCGVSCP